MLYFIFINICYELEPNEIVLWVLIYTYVKQFLHEKRSIIFEDF